MANTRKVQVVTPAAAQTQAYADAERQRALADMLQKRSMAPRDMSAMQGSDPYLLGLTQLGEALMARYANKGATQAEGAAESAARAGIESGLAQLAPPKPVSGQIDPIDGEAPIPLAPDAVYHNTPERQQMRGALNNLPTQNAQQVVAQALWDKVKPKEQKLTTVPYGSMVIDENGKMVTKNDRLPGSGSRKQIEIVSEMLKEAYPDDTPAQHAERVRLFDQTFKVTDIAGVQNLIGSKTGDPKALTSIGQVADNAAIVKAAEESGKVSGNEETKRFYEAPVAKAKADAAIAKIDETIKKAGDIKNDPALSRATGFMAYIPSLFGGGAKDVESAIESLKVGLGLGELLDLKAAGGTLGQVTEVEGAWLQNSVESLRTEQNPDTYRRKLGQIIQHMQGSKQRIIAAYEAQYGRGAAKVSNPGLRNVQAAQSGDVAAAAAAELARRRASGPK